METLVSDSSVADKIGKIDGQKGTGAVRSVEFQHGVRIEKREI